MNIQDISSFLLPLLRMLLGMAAGLLLANILENLHWTGKLAKMALPLASRAHLGKYAASAFSLALLSSHASNGLLSEKFSQGKITTAELIIANLFNSLPASLLHMPTIFFLAWPVLGSGAFIYTGVILFSACLRLILSIMLGYFLLPAKKIAIESESVKPGTPGFRQGLSKAISAFMRRLPRLYYYTIPFYVLMYISQKAGIFNALEAWLNSEFSWPEFIKPQSIGIILLQLPAELGAALGAASAILESGVLSIQEVILSLLIGNILASPMRAARHQYPVYSGFYPPGRAFFLVISNQALRILTMFISTLIYAGFFSHTLSGSDNL